MLTFARRALIAILVLVLAAASWDVATYDAKAWRADYEHLKRELAQRYANLDWIVAHRRLDLRKLDAETGAAIDNAHSHVLATLALRRFVRAFADPHLRLTLANGGHSSADSATAPEPTVTSCEEAGYEDDSHAAKFPFDRLPDWKPVRGGNFPTGIAGDLGVLRISAFGEDRYLGACREAFRAGLTKRDLQLAVRARLNAELQHLITELKSLGARRLLVDISGNGGGSEWVEDVIAMMTDRELTRQPARLAVPGCDRSGIWRGEAVCPVLEPAGAPARLITGTARWTGPLFVLLDRSTGSAAEDFVVWLKENGVAVALGERTVGAGCGYVDGGGRIALNVAPFTVMAPNCSRYLSDGTNEIEGIAPNIPIPMNSEDKVGQITALTAALRE